MQISTQKMPFLADQKMPFLADEQDPSVPKGELAIPLTLPTSQGYGASKQS